MEYRDGQGGDVKTYPFNYVVESLLKRRLEGWDFLMQFNCTKCGVKQTIDGLNKVYEKGQCEECGAITDLKLEGCNYMLWRSQDGTIPVEDLLTAVRNQPKHRDGR
jgi:hypothetical protein